MVGASGANEFSETTKLFMLLGTYVSEQHGSRYYGKAMNITRRLTAAYDAVLANYDLLLMPTVPIKATPLPSPEASREEQIDRALEMIANTAVFDITHHPAMSIPCGLRDGLPVGMMLVGKQFDEPTIYRAAHAFRAVKRLEIDVAAAPVAPSKKGAIEKSVGGTSG